MLAFNVMITRERTTNNVFYLFILTQLRYYSPKKGYSVKRYRTTLWSYPQKICYKLHYPIFTPSIRELYPSPTLLLIFHAITLSHLIQQSHSWAIITYTWGHHCLLIYYYFRFNQTSLILVHMANFQVGVWYYCFIMCIGWTHLNSRSRQTSTKYD